MGKVDELIADYERSLRVPVRHGLGQIPQVTEEQVQDFYRRLTGKDVITFSMRDRGMKGYFVIISGDAYPRKQCQIWLVSRWWERI